jgi:hypothetical protein
VSYFSLYSYCWPVRTLRQRGKKGQSQAAILPPSDAPKARQHVGQTAPSVVHDVT